MNQKSINRRYRAHTCNQVPFQFCDELYHLMSRL